MSRNIVILTGAGISAESGVATFRASDGLWENHRIEDVASPEGFARNPKLVQEFYNKRRAQLASIEPNPAHVALAHLEADWPGEVLLVTQNVDDLHERAGSRNLIHMHGELKKARCLHTGNIVDWEGDIVPGIRCACCNKTASLRPHIVWFGEMPLEMERIYAALGNADIFVSIGTSGNVYPAASFVQEARNTAGARTVEINLEPSLNHHVFDEKLYGHAGTEVPKFVRSLLASLK